MNEEKIIEVLANIECELGGVSTNPDRQPVGFNMHNWLVVPSQMTNVCGTTACFAGHAMLADGWSIDFKQGFFYKDGYFNTTDAEDEGAKILGLEPEEAARLFYLEDIDEVYSWIAGHMGIEESVLRDKVRDYR